jgi:FkbM family methyltransferase
LFGNLAGIEGINRHETEYLYREIFVKRAYLRYGLSIGGDAVVFDVGANIGMFSLFALSECPTASLYAFEPIPSIFEKLERNLAHVSARAHLFRCGLSDIERFATFTYYPGYSIMSAQSAYAASVAEREFVKRQVLRERPVNRSPNDKALEYLDRLLERRFHEVHCQCHLRPLSDVVEECGVTRIDLLKMDVLRGEADVLRGIRDGHWPMIRQITMEVYDGSSSSTAGRLRRVVADLQARQYRVNVEQSEHLSGSDRHAVFAVR